MSGNERELLRVVQAARTRRITDSNKNQSGLPTAETPPCRPELMAQAAGLRIIVLMPHCRSLYRKDYPGSERNLETFGGTIGRSVSLLSPGMSGTWPRNKSNLVDALKSVFAGKTLSVGDAAQKVIEAGYRSTSLAFGQIVNLTLSKSDQFERVGRGLYKAK